MRAMSLTICGFVTAACTAGCGEPQKYQRGKDTVESFGDGNWSILKTGGSDDGSRKLHLYCRETVEPVVRNVANWRQAGDWVYAVGEDGAFIAVNFRTSYVIKCPSPDAAPEEHRSALRALRRK
ncbi:hypothetical protein [Gemmata sp.]|uniref:hypothetical protein n=1 Tax=Gemmata sp. TaxID=1914242 RepID=UPI003F6F1581